MPNGIRSTLPDAPWTTEVDDELAALRRELDALRSQVQNQGRSN